MTPTSVLAETTELSDASHFMDFLGQVFVFDPATMMKEVFTWKTKDCTFILF